jgi:hypothetical protein
MRSVLDNPLPMIGRVLGQFLVWSAAVLAANYIGLTLGLGLGSGGTIFSPAAAFVLDWTGRFVWPILLAAYVITALAWLFPIMLASEKVSQRIRAWLLILVVWIGAGVWIARLL